MKTKQIIEQIHNEFLTAGDKLLAEAKAIINDKHALLEKAGRLERVGFKMSSEVVVGKNLAITKELADLIIHYQQSYPNNKFITEQQVQTICKKYNLTCGPISRYKGFVPNEKLKLVEAFYIKDCDLNNLTCKDVIFEYPSSQDALIKKLKISYPNGIYPEPNSHGLIENIFIKSYKKIENRSLCICAPAKEMDLTSLSKIGTVFMSLITITVPDPIILQPCKGGYLIIAAWGDEASDPIVVNEKMN